MFLELSVVKLPADAFGSPAKYYVEETAQVVQDIMKYFSSNDKTPPNLLQVCSTIVAYMKELRRPTSVTAKLSFSRPNHSLNGNLPFSRQCFLSYGKSLFLASNLSLLRQCFLSHEKTFSINILRVVMLTTSS